MAYDHLIIEGPDGDTFAKIHNPNNFSDPSHEKHSKRYLKKEYIFLKHLQNNDYNHLPANCKLTKNSLTMDALKPEDGWHWRAPQDDKARHDYISDSLTALDALANIKTPGNRHHELVKPTSATLWYEGWNNITNESIIYIENKIKSVSRDFKKYQKTRAKKLLKDIETLQEQALQINKPKNLVLSHGDARQSNIAWHPDRGLKIVDWSWADLAPEKSDSTMFLIDLAKSDHDVSPYMERYFNHDHALVLIGFWLAHSILPTRDGDETVRIQQIASAATAYKLVNDYNSGVISGCLR